MSKSTPPEVEIRAREHLRAAFLEGWQRGHTCGYVQAIDGYSLTSAGNDWEYSISRSAVANLLSALTPDAGRR